MKRTGNPCPGLQESLGLLHRNEKPAAQPWVSRPAQGVWVLFPLYSLPSWASNFPKGEKKTGSGKKNDLESHLLIIVSGEWKTEFPLWSNYSLVSLMKPNHESFQCLADVSEAWFSRVLGPERKYSLTSWSFLIIFSFHLVPRKNVGHFSLTRKLRAGGT